MSNGNGNGNRTQADGWIIEDFARFILCGGKKVLGIQPLANQWWLAVDPDDPFRVVKMLRIDPPVPEPDRAMRRRKPV